MRRIRLVLLVAMLATLGLACACSTASAVIEHLAGGRAVSYMRGPDSLGRGLGAALPFDLGFHDAEYDGGPVMPSNTNYAFYWDPPEAQSYAPEYEEGIDTYWKISPPKAAAIATVTRWPPSTTTPRATSPPTDPPSGVRSSTPTHSLPAAAAPVPPASPTNRFRTSSAVPDRTRPSRRGSNTSTSC